MGVNPFKCKVPQCSNMNRGVGQWFCHKHEDLWMESAEKLRAASIHKAALMDFINRVDAEERNSGQGQGD